MSRENWNEYFIKIAEQVSSRATCDRKHVGCIIVKDKNILASGYNGSIAGLEHCDDIGHDMENNSCVRTVHSEQNAIAQAAKNGVAINNATMYVNTFPCWNCFKLIANVGIKEVYYKDSYRISEKVLLAAEKLSIKLIKIL